jgi:hypothetical protein
MAFSRTKLLSTGTALAVFGPVLMGTMIRAAEAATPDDIALFNGAIPLENAAVKAYSDAAGLNLLSPPVLAIAKGFMGDHKAHADALSAAVKAAGGTPATTTAQIPYPSLNSEADILMFAEKIERMAATAYLTDIGKLSDPALSKIMASILGT